MAASSRLMIAEAERRLTLVFLLKAALGVRAVEVACFRFQRTSSGKKDEQTCSSSKIDVGSDAAARYFPIFRGAIIHGAIVVLGFAAGAWWFSLAYIFGVLLVFPFVGALRQLLEHRREDADPSKDYKRFDHGHYTRLFNSGPFSQTFGGAGFRLHLLHHWEPQVSYTNLVELLDFLRNTPMRAILERRQSTYFAAFKQLFSLG
jgi:hypothetical protein